MSRTNTTFGLLQALASVVALSVLFWSFGVPTMRFAQAAYVTEYSNTLSDSAPSVGSNHTITFVTPSGIANGETITIDFSDGNFGTSSITVGDIDVYDDATLLSSAANCSATDETGVSFTGAVLTIEFCPGDGAFIPTNGTTTILIGTNATGGTNQIVNPSVANSYQLPLTAGSSDLGETRVAIVAPVVVTATVDTALTFTVDALDPTDGDVNQSPITATSTATTVPFGVLDPGTPVTLGQQLSVSTNAAYGFAVTAQVDQQLTSGTSEIAGFIEGAFTSTPTSWQSPSPLIGNSDTWGHWGLTTQDQSIEGGDPFDVAGAGEAYVSASTTPVTVFAHNGPADGTTAHIGRTRVGYRAEITDLQPAGEYTATLTYVATPVF